MEGVLALFESTAEKNPRDRAIVFDDGGAVTYGELNELAEGVASIISSLLSSLAVEAVLDDGLVATPLVAIMMDRNVAFVASMLGVLKAGAGYVPIDPTFPADRQSYIFEQSKCVCLLVDMENYQRALDLGVTLPKHFVRLDGKTGLCENHNRGDAQRPRTSPRLCDPNSLAYVLYTSGSTGKPKGVMVKNVGVVNQINWFAESLGAGKHTRVLGLATFCFDISVLEIYLPLTRGGLLVLASASTQKDPFRILELIKQHKVTFFQATPTTYDMMAAVGWKGEAEPSIDFLVGGEAFRPSLLPFVRNGRSFRNVYGPTETTVWASEYLVPKDFPVGVMPPVGRPGPNYIFRVVDHAKGAPWQEVGPGQEGELWISGISVGRGYLGRPELTKEVYLPDPFAAGQGLVYRTGDLVKLCDDGVNYQFLQRIDNQVKIDGYRIELAEIENVYTLHDLVEQAVAIVSDKKLVIYLKPSSADRSLSAAQQEEVHAFARRKLMHYMMPKATVVVPAFQLTATSKIDRKALPPVLFSPNNDSPLRLGRKTSSFSIASEIGPTNLVSHILATVEQTTGIKLLPRASFAAMGVDSLGAVLFIKQLSDSLGGQRIEPKKLYAAGMTIKRFALELQEDLLKNNPDVLIKLKCAHYASSHDVEQGNAPKGGLGALVLHEFSEEDDEGSDSFVETHGSKLEEDFSFNCIAVNRKMFEGLRGLFTYMVLAGHYFRYPGTLELQNFCSYCTKGDVFLFVMLTGFSTSLQLRLPPKFDVGEDGKRVLLPREPFKWHAFLVTRCLGLFPILWIALLLNIPIWYRPDIYSDGMSGPDISSPSSDHAKACVALYIIGMQSWYRPKCHYVGPNSTVYASCILNIFIIYTMFRLIIRFLQDGLMTHREEHFVLPCEEEDDEAEAKERDEWGGHRIKSANRTWLQWAGNAATIASYSRYNTEQALMLSGLLFICAFFPVYKIFYDAAWVGQQTQNAIAYMPYFLLGTAGAGLMEAWHSALWHRNKDSRQPWRRKLSAFICYVYAFTNDMCKLDGSSQEPAVQDGERLKVAPTSAESLASSVQKKSQGGGLESGDADEERRSGEKCQDDEDKHVNTKPPSSRGVVVWSRVVASVSASTSVSVPQIPERGVATCFAMYLVKMCWRFYPDLLFIGSACVATQAGWLVKIFYKPRPRDGVGDSPEMVLWFIGLPLVAVMYIFIVCLQRGSARHNFSRLFFESPLMTFIGAASYPVYLLQAVMFEYYAPRLYYTYYNEDPSPPFAYSPKLKFGRPNGGQWQGMWWFSNLHWGVKFICFMILVVMGWLIQRIIQERMVTFLYLKALVAYRRIVAVQNEAHEAPQREADVTRVAVM